MGSWGRGQGYASGGFEYKIEQGLTMDTWGVVS